MNRIKCFLPLLFLLLAANIQAQQLPQVDSLSVYILNRTVQTIQSLEACSFKVNTTYDVLDEDLGLVKHAGEEHVYMNFPDKAKIHFFGDKGRRVLWYNKTALVYYSFDKNQYSVIKTPDSIIKMMDVVSKEYGIEFPAADYFYDSFVDDLINTGGSLKYLGISSVNGKNCFHIAGKDLNGTGYQFWISDDDFFLPVKMVLVYGGEKSSPQFEAIYSDWSLNPNLPDGMFQSAVPPKAIEVKSKKEK